MDVNISKCQHCKQRIHYTESRLLPEGGGVCLECAAQHGYRACEECHDYFIPVGETERFCDPCVKRIFARFI